MPQTFGPSGANQLDQLAIDRANKAKADLSVVRPVVDPSKPFSRQKSMLGNLNTVLDETGKIVQKDMDDTRNMITDINENPPQAQNIAASSYFNLSKIAQGFTDPSMNSAPDQFVQQDPANEQQKPSFTNDTELKQWLVVNASNQEAINQLISSIPSDSEFQGDSGLNSNSRQFVKDSIQRFTQPETSDSDRSILAAQIFEKINGSEEGNIQGVLTEASVEEIIKHSESLISSFAKKTASTKPAKKTTKKASAYNLKKEAQFHGTGHTEFINFGPESKRMLPYSNTGMLASDWHVWERAKNHGFIFDDHAVDFDTFWRGNIMDKYSRPYRNEKGEWVGGYMNKRFEVDRNIPEGNNYQLLPGQKRRPILPEFGTTESRMEASRKAMAKDRGYSPTNEKAEAYNWKEASSATLLKTSQTSHPSGQNPDQSLQDLNTLAEQLLSYWGENPATIQSIRQTAQVEGEGGLANLLMADYGTLRGKQLARILYPKLFSKIAAVKKK